MSPQEAVEKLNPGRVEGHIGEWRCFTTVPQGMLYISERNVYHVTLRLILARKLRIGSGDIKGGYGTVYNNMLTFFGPPADPYEPAMSKEEFYAAVENGVEFFS